MLRRMLVLVVAAVVAAMVAATVAPAAAYNAPGPRWPGKTIRYYDTLPKNWDWSVQQAVRTWNRSGVNMKCPNSAQNRRFSNHCLRFTP